MAVPKILITGSNGQLGRELMDYFGSCADVTGIDLEDLDILNPEEVRRTFRSIAPDVVLHTAAYTDVDRAESEPDRAMAVNADGSRNVALASREVGARLVYYSTDYVFNGKKKKSYVEDDRPDPINVYGRSKLEGERLVSEIADNSVIMRIAWLYGHNGKNFVNTILKVINEKIEQLVPGESLEWLRVVDDQTGSPTWSREVARQTEAILEHELVGIVHASAEGQATWYDFAVAIVEACRLPVMVSPCATSVYPRPAERPFYSVLENARLKELGINRMADWKDALNEFFAVENQTI
ncbi:MAG TPA: dTDP-4-dehydrorhamnose reductase [candidate division Zixibacteria bacterium]|nr:dTDP-4-dehydrorhamnose reductase [candidate division Zixibacteria bacterium]